MYRNIRANSEILICSCNNIEHQIHIYKDEEFKSVAMSIHLVSGSFWKRLINGIKYIFGYKSKYGDFDEFIFKPLHGDSLIQIGVELKQYQNNDETNSPSEITDEI